MQQMIPPNETLDLNGQTIDQPRPQINPAGIQRVNPTRIAKRSPKQPGQDPRNPQDRPVDAE